MALRRLGKTDLQLSEITLGTWGLASGAYGFVESHLFEATVRHAIEVGVTSIDLAPMWGEGEGERVVGRVCKATRDRVQYITRAGRALTEGKPSERFDRQSLIEACEGSLVRLGTDHIDLWMLHNPSEAVLRGEEWIEAANKLRAAGKIRAYGASVGTVEEARLALGRGAECICLIYNVFSSDDVHDLAADLEAAGAGLCARSPLAYGLLSGTWPAATRFSAGDHRSRRWSASELRTRLGQIDALSFLVAGDVPDLASAALRFTLSNHQVTSAIVGARTPAQIDHAARAVATASRLSDETLTKIGQVLAALGI